MKKKQTNHTQHSKLRRQCSYFILASHEAIASQSIYTSSRAVAMPQGPSHCPILRSPAGRDCRSNVAEFAHWLEEHSLIECDFESFWGRRRREEEREREEREGRKGGREGGREREKESTVSVVLSHQWHHTRVGAAINIANLYRCQCNLWTLHSIYTAVDCALLALTQSRVILKSRDKVYGNSKCHTCITTATCTCTYNTVVIA